MYLPAVVEAEIIYCSCTNLLLPNPQGEQPQEAPVLLLLALPSPD